MSRDTEALIADALKQENHLDRAEIGPIWAQVAIAQAILELRPILQETNRILTNLATLLSR